MKWGTKPLCEIAEIIRGVTFSKSDATDSNAPGLIPIIRAGNISEGLNLADDMVFLEPQLISETQLLRENDIVMCMSSGSANVLGKCGLVDQPWLGSFGAFLATIRANEFVASARYLSHFFRTREFRTWASGSSGIGIKNIRSSDLKSHEIPLPPLDEQKRIAAILDQADALRRLRTRALDRLNALGQAIFHEMFGEAGAKANDWQTVALETLVHGDDRINYGVVQPGDHDPNGVPIIRAGDLTSSTVELGSVKRISRDIDKEYSRSRLKGGEILIGCVGSIGTTLIAPKEYQGANIARAVARVPVDPSRCNPVYLNAFLRTAAVRNYFLKEVRLVAQPTLNIKQIKETAIILAPRELQDSFAERLGVIESAQAGVRLAAYASDTLFTSLQHRAFRGEL